MIRVRDCGAVGDGMTDDTDAVVRAIDLVRRAGGGSIYFDAGIYLCGTLELCSDLELILGPGAVLKAQEDIACFRQDSNPGARSLRHYFLHLKNVENVTITGPGMIHGSGYAFWEKDYLQDDLPPVADTRDAPDDVHEPVYRYHVLRPKRERIVVIYGEDSRNIRLCDMRIEDAAAYTVWLIGCENIRIHGVEVHNRRSGPNTDVLDIDCCRRVRISDCCFAAGDDCIAIKSDPNRTGTGFACEDVVVSNCVLSSSACGIRVGYEGDAPIRDMTFHNITIHDAKHGIDILSIHPVVKFARIEQGTPIDRLLFSNITMRNVGQAFFIWAGMEKPHKTFGGHMRDLIFSNIVADSSAASWIGTAEYGSMACFTLDNVTIRTRWNGDFAVPEDVTAIPSHWGGNFHAGALVMRGVERVKMRNCVCEVTDRDIPAFTWKDMPSFEIDGVRQAPSGTLDRERDLSL